MELSWVVDAHPNVRRLLPRGQMSTEVCILDAGCGEGRFARQMAERGAKVTAFDLSERMIANALKGEAEKPLGIDYSLADMTDLSRFADASFDIALSYLSLIDVEDYDVALNESRANPSVPAVQFLFSIVPHSLLLTPGASGSHVIQARSRSGTKTSSTRRSTTISRHASCASRCGPPPCR